MKNLRLVYNLLMLSSLTTDCVLCGSTATGLFQFNWWYKMLLDTSVLDIQRENFAAYSGLNHL